MELGDTASLPFSDSQRPSLESSQLTLFSRTAKHHAERQHHTHPISSPSLRQEDTRAAQSQSWRQGTQAGQGRMVSCLPCYCFALSLTLSFMLTGRWIRSSRPSDSPSTSTPSTAKRSAALRISWAALGRLAHLLMLARRQRRTRLDQPMGGGALQLGALGHREHHTLIENAHTHTLFLTIFIGIITHDIAYTRIHSSISLQQ